MKRLLFIILLSISLTLFGCNDTEQNINEQTEIKEEQFEIALLITIPDEVTQLESVDMQNITVEAGDTIIEATEKAGNELDINGSGENAYVEGINGLYSLDEGPSSGWLVKVNDEFINVGPGAYVLEEDDIVEWLYTLDFNKEFD